MQSNLVVLPLLLYLCLPLNVDTLILSPLCLESLDLRHLFGKVSPVVGLVGGRGRNVNSVPPMLGRKPLGLETRTKLNWI